MPPKPKFNKEAIVEAAYEIALEKGLSAITARSVANRLGSSVAPIYVNFATIEDLTTAVVGRVFTITNELVAKYKGANLFENMGKASLEFARAYPVLFRELTMEPNPYMSSYDTVEDSILEALAEDESMRGLTLDERRKLLFKMRVFQLGLAAMVANGHLPAWLENWQVEEIFLEVGDELLRIQQIKREEINQ